MSIHASDTTIGFGPGETGSTLLRGALASAVARWPTVFGPLHIPEDPAQFKRELPEIIVHFEAARAACPERVDVARLLAEYVPTRTKITIDGTQTPLAEALSVERAAPPLTEIRGTAAPGWTPEIVWRGQRYRGRAIRDLADRLLAEHQLTDAAARALRWVADEMLGTPLDLRAHRFVLMGAGAELAPTPYLLSAGARVLFIDSRSPALDPSMFAGTLAHSAASDLLRDPLAVRASVADEASSAPIHLGLYAYAPGGGRELLLAAVMNAIAASLPDAALQSIALLVSPTTPGEVQPEDQAYRRARRASAPRWQRALVRARLLREPAHHRHGDVEVSRSIVPLQGPTYLAAQYLAKMAITEVWAVDRGSVRISANTAGITHTRSLEHPLFLAGFLGAPDFGFEIFRPDDTRVLSTLLMLHDALNPLAPSADRTCGPAEQARRLASQTVHGGVRSAPFVFDHTIRVAAVLGLVKRPSLLLQMRG